MPDTLTQAKQYIERVDLPDRPRNPIRMGGAEDGGEVFDKARQQAQVVGSGLFAFAVGVTPEVREAISDSALLAQLVASKATSQQNDPIKWFDEYSKCLENVGWTLQAAGWSDYSKTGTAAEVNEQITAVLSAVLGPGAAALTMLTSTVKALKAMNPTSPWITIFDRESQKAKIARFQVGLVEEENDSGVLVNLLGCLIEAQSNITQVLFFKWRQARASFRANNASVSVNRASLKALGPEIRKRTRDYQLEYLSGVLTV